MKGQKMADEKNASILKKDYACGCSYPQAIAMPQYLRAPALDRCPIHKEPLTRLANLVPGAPPIRVLLI